MKEKFFNIGYSSYLKEKEKIRWTSKLKNKIIKHKIITFFIIIAITCITMNCMLIYNFMKIIESM